MKKLLSIIFLLFITIQTGFSQGSYWNLVNERLVPITSSWKLADSLITGTRFLLASDSTGDNGYVKRYFLGNYAPITGSESIVTTGILTSGGIGGSFTAISIAYIDTTSPNGVMSKGRAENQYAPRDTTKNLRIDVQAIYDSLKTHRTELDTLKSLIENILNPSAADTTIYLISGILGTDDFGNEGHIVPLKTIEALNTKLLQPGDKVRFRRGERYPGTLTINYSGTEENPITVESYDEGDLPSIIGGDTVKTWGQNGNIWSAYISGTVSNLHVDGVQQTWARTPNTGNYFRVDAGTSKTKIISADITASEDALVGAYLNIYSQIWSWETNKYIYSNKDDSLGVNTLQWTPGTGYVFYITGNIPALGDTCGEWWKYGDSLYYYPSTGINPNNLTMIATVRNYGIQIAGDYITVQNLITEKQAVAGIAQYEETTPDYITIQDCIIKDQWTSGINFFNASTHLTLLRDSVIDCNASGINVYYCTYPTVSHCHVARIGVKPGRSNQPFGIIADDDYADIVCNRVDSTGNSGIYGGNHNTIAYNYVSNTCLSSNDAGGIYVGGKHATRVYNNLVHNAVGDASLFGGTIPVSTVGLYADAACDGVYWGYNVVWGTMHSGYFSQYNTVRDTIIGNIFYDIKTPSGANWWEYSAMIDIMQSASYSNHGLMVIKDNLMFSSDTSAYFIHYSQNTLADDSTFLPIGTVSGNIYCNPTDKKRMVWLSKENTTNYVSHVLWGDSCSETGALTIYRHWLYAATQKDSLFFNPYDDAYDFTVAADTWKDYAGSLETTTLTVPAHSALLRFNSPSSDSLIIGYTEDNVDTDGIISIANGTGGRAQCFYGQGNPISGAWYWAKRIGDGAYVTARLMANIGGATYGGTARPVTNASLAVSDSVDASTWSTDYEWHYIPYQTPYTPENGVIYHQGITSWAASSSHCISIGRDGSSSTCPSNPSSTGNPAGAWSQGTSDLGHKFYETLNPP